MEPRISGSAAGRNRLSCFLWSPPGGCERQIDLHLQSTFRAVRRDNFSAVKTHGALSDGQSQPNASCQAPPRIVQPVERQEQLVQRIPWNARPTIADPKRSLRAV